MRLTIRDRQAVQEAVLAYARDEFPRWDVRGEYKDPVVLLRSFRTRFESSRAIDALLSDERLPMDVLERIFENLVHFYDDPAISKEHPPEWKAPRGRHVARERKLENAIGVLERALEDARKSRSWTLARRFEGDLRRRVDELEHLAVTREYFESRAPPGRPLLPPAGAPKRTDAVLAERLEIVLSRREPVPPGEPPRWLEPPHLKPPERHRLIADLVSDFQRKRTPEQIRALLKDARLREERALFERKWRERESPPV